MFTNFVYADELVVFTDKSSYSLGATIKINGKLTLEGNPITQGLVAVQVEDRLGNLKLIRSILVGNSPSPWKVRITSFYACDSFGEPKDHFSCGTLAYFTATVESLDTVLERQVILAFNLFDSKGVSISVTYATFSLAPLKKFTFFTSMPIPEDAYTGTAIAYVSALTKLPKDGGQPYCQEKSVELTIGEVSSNTGEFTLPQSLTSTAGSFSLSFKLPGNAILGFYNVFVSARYNAWASALFDYFWLETDVNRDGRVNILDVSMAGTSFRSKLGDSKYNSLVDINKDGVINILDISAIAKDFRKAML